MQAKRHPPWSSERRGRGDPEMKGCRSSSSYPIASSFSRLRERDPAEKEEGRKEGEDSQLWMM